MNEATKSETKKALLQRILCNKIAHSQYFFHICNLVAYILVLKKRSLHIILSCLLLANLLFTQVAINFLHRHESSKIGHSAKNDEQSTSIDIQNEKCEICSLHICKALFYEVISPLHIGVSIVFSLFNWVVSEGSNATIAALGRAPPIF